MLDRYGEPGRLLFDHLSVLLRFRLVPHESVPEVLCRRRNDRERRLQLVRDGRDEFLLACRELFCPSACLREHDHAKEENHENAETDERVLACRARGHLRERSVPVDHLYPNRRQNVRRDAAFHRQELRLVLHLPIRSNARIHLLLFRRLGTLHPSISVHEFFSTVCRFGFSLPVIRWSVFGGQSRGRPRERPCPQ